MPKAKKAILRQKLSWMPGKTPKRTGLSLPGACDRVVGSPHGENGEDRKEDWRNGEPGSRWPKEGFLRATDPAWGSVVTKCLLSTCGAKQPLFLCSVGGAGGELKTSRCTADPNWGSS